MSDRQETAAPPTPEQSPAKRMPAPVDGLLRQYALRVPEVIRECSGIVVFGKRIKSLVFSTDLAIIKNINADAIIAVYPFTPQSIISDAIVRASDIPVFVGVGGGLTQGHRVVNLAMYAEMQGATGVVVNAPTSDESIAHIKDVIDIPILVTVVNADTDYAARLSSGAAIFNVAAADQTPDIIRDIKRQFPDVPVIGTGGPTEESIRQTILAGANAISYTPPACAEIFKDSMRRYREGKTHH